MFSYQILLSIYSSVVLKKPTLHTIKIQAKIKKKRQDLTFWTLEPELPEWEE